MYETDAERVLDLIARGYIKYDARVQEWEYSSSTLAIYRCMSWQELVTRMKRYDVWGEDGG